MSHNATLESNDVLKPLLLLSLAGEMLSSTLVLRNAAADQLPVTDAWRCQQKRGAVVLGFDPIRYLDCLSLVLVDAGVVG